MAAPLQTFLFHHGKDMAGKNIGLIVSSASSGISGVEADARRLVPAGNFLSPSLWIRSSQTSNVKSLIENWLKAINYDSLVSGISSATIRDEKSHVVYSLSGIRQHDGMGGVANHSGGILIIDGRKIVLPSVRP